MGGRNKEGRPEGDFNPIGRSPFGIRGNAGQKKEKGSLGGMELWKKLEIGPPAAKFSYKSVGGDPLEEGGVERGG